MSRHCIDRQHYLGTEKLIKILRHYRLIYKALKHFPNESLRQSATALLKQLPFEDINLGCLDPRAIDYHVATILSKVTEFPSIITDTTHLVILIDGLGQLNWDVFFRIIDYIPVNGSEKFLHLMMQLERRGLLTRLSFDDMFYFITKHFDKLIAVIDPLNNIYGDYYAHPDAYWNSIFDTKRVNNDSLTLLATIYTEILTLNMMSPAYIDHMTTLLSKNLAEALPAHLEDITQLTYFKLIDENRLFYLSNKQILYLLCSIGLSLKHLDENNVGREIFNAIDDNNADFLKILNWHGASVEIIIAYFLNPKALRSISEIYSNLSRLNAWSLLDTLSIHLLKQNTNIELTLDFLLNYILRYDFLNASETLKEKLKSNQLQVDWVCRLGITIFDLCKFPDCLLDRIFGCINADNVIVLQYIQTYTSRYIFLLVLLNCIDRINEITNYLKEYNALTDLPNYALNILCQNLNKTNDEGGLLPNVKRTLDAIFFGLTEFVFISNDLVRNEIMMNLESFKLNFKANFTLNSFIDLHPTYQLGCAMLDADSSRIIYYLYHSIPLEMQNAIVVIFLHPDVLDKIKKIAYRLRCHGENPVSVEFLQDLLKKYIAASIKTLESMKCMLDNYLFGILEFDYVSHHSDEKKVLCKYRSLLECISCLGVPVSEFAPYFLKLADIDQENFEFLYTNLVHHVLMMMKHSGVSTENFLDCFLRLNVISVLLKIINNLLCLNIFSASMLKTMVGEVVEAVADIDIMDESSAVQFFTGYCQRVGNLDFLPVAESTKKLLCLQQKDKIYRVLHCGLTLGQLACLAEKAPSIFKTVMTWMDHEKMLVLGNLCNSVPAKTFYLILFNGLDILDKLLRYSALELAYRESPVVTTPGSLMVTILLKSFAQNSDVAVTPRTIRARLFQLYDQLVPCESGVHTPSNCLNK